MTMTFCGFLGIVEMRSGLVEYPISSQSLRDTFVKKHELPVGGSIMKADFSSPAAKQAMFEAIVEAVAIRNEQGHKAEPTKPAPEELHAQGELAPYPQDRACVEPEDDDPMSRYEREAMRLLTADPKAPKI